MPFLNNSALSAWLLTLSIVGYPAVGLLAAVLDWPSRWMSIPFRAGVAFLAIILIVLAWRHRTTTPWTWVLLSWLTLYGVRLTYNLLAGYPGAEYELIFYGMVVILPVLAILTSDPDKLEPMICKPLMWLAAFIVAFAISGEWLNLFGSNSLTYTGRLSTNTVNPITLGHVSVTLLLALVAWNQKKTKPQLLLMIIMASIGLAGLSMTGSRGPFIALLVPIICILTFSNSQKTAFSTRLLSVSIIVLAMLLFWRPLPMDDLIAQSFRDRPSPATASQEQLQANNPTSQQTTKFDKLSPENKPSPEVAMSPETERIVLERSVQQTLSRLKEEQAKRASLTDNASQHRLTLWHNSLNAISQKPWFGQSNWEANRGEYPHNLILEAFQNLGIIGGAIFCLLLIKASFLAWNALKSGQTLISILFVQALVASQLSGSLFAQAQLWLTLVLLLNSSTEKKIETMNA